MKKLLSVNTKRLLYLFVFILSSGVTTQVLTQGLFDIIASRPDGSFPDYWVGENVTLVVETVPVQKVMPVYSWRKFNGVVQRDGDLLGYTDINGKLIINAVLPLDCSGICGSYTEEQFNVGSSNYPRSNQLNYMVFSLPIADVSVSRPDANYPQYVLLEGNTNISLLVTTTPVQAFQPVYMWRDYYDRRSGLTEVVIDGSLIGYTDINGQFAVNTSLPPVTDTCDLCGDYTDQFTIESPHHPRSNLLNFDITTLTRPDPPGGGDGPGTVF